MSEMSKRDPLVFLQEMLSNAMDRGDEGTLRRVSRMIDELTVTAVRQQETACRTSRGA